MSDRLRIAEVAPIAWPVGSGESIEGIVWLLCEELIRRGHEVTLFATGDSHTSARLIATYERGYEHAEELWDWRLHESLHVAAAFERAGEFDVIHSHDYYFALPFTRLTRTPVVHTYHVEADPDVIASFSRYPEATVVAVSQWQRSTLAALRDTVVIRHGIDTAAFPFRPEAEDYLLFLGRMIEDKGPVDAVALAHRAGRRLVLAGPGDVYFEREVRPLVDGEQVTYVGAVGTVERNRLLSGAAALLLPLRYPEPFGLVMIEAMACGTPVLARSLGAVPELVEPGLTGYHAATLGGMHELVPAVLALDRTRVRERAVQRHDLARVVDEHEALYHRLAARGAADASS